MHLITRDFAGTSFKLKLKKSGFGVVNSHLLVGLLSKLDVKHVRSPFEKEIFGWVAGGK